MTLVAMGLGGVWALFVFNFDRVVVISMDKRLSIQKQIGIAIPRILVAVFISFVVATPLEVLIFSDRIADQIEKMQAEKRKERFQSLESGFGLNSVRERVQSTGQEVEKLDSLAQAETPNTVRYQNLEDEFKRCRDTLQAVKTRKQESIQKQRAQMRQRASERNQIQSQINRKDETREELRSRVNDAPADSLKATRKRIRGLNADIDGLADSRNRLNSAIAQARKRIDRFQSQIQDQKEECKGVREKIRQEVQQFRSEKKAERDSLEKVRAEQDSILGKRREKVYEEKQEAESGLERSYSGNFVTQLEAMWELVDEEDDNTLLWVNLFLTGLFLFIETGPVLIKLFSGMGAYEKLKKRKSNVLDETKEVEEKAGRKLAEEKSELRKEAELELYKSILEEAKEVKEDVATERLRRLRREKLEENGRAEAPPDNLSSLRGVTVDQVLLDDKRATPIVDGEAFSEKNENRD
jgi:predicted  nucleic acid-binding Zn-ribbon protein